MCTIALALTAASTVIGGASAIQQGQAQASAARYQAKVADMNAEISQRQAKDALERGAREEQQQRFKTAQIMGRQRAAMGANGVDLGFGSPLDTIADTAVMGELDALNVRKNFANEAYDYEVAAANGRANAAMSRSSAKSALTGSYLSAAGTVLGGASKGYSDWARPRIGAY